MNGGPAQRADAIHQVDSALGILLVAAVFLANVMINRLGEYPSERGEILIIILSLLMVFSILSGLSGILTGSWRSKLFGWLMGSYLLLAGIITMVQALAWRWYSVILPQWQICVFAFLAFNASSAFVLYAVTDAYFDRLSSVSCQDDQLDAIRKSRKCKFWSVVIASSAVLAWALFFRIYQ